MKKITLFLIACLTGMVAIAQDFSRIIMIGTYAEYDPGMVTDGDDDEKAAAAWLISKGGSYVGAESILKSADEGGIDLADYDVVWIHLDRTDALDLADFRENQLGYLGNEEVTEAIRSYYKEGGSLFLTVYGSIYLKDLGRIDIDPDLVSFGEGEDKEDTWFIGATHGTDHGMNVYDHTDDPLYDELTFEMSLKINGEEYKTFPLIGPGHKEDHNCFWSMDIPGNEIPNNDEQKIIIFQEMYDAEVLATWAHVQDYFGAAIVRWNPTEEYKGKAITIGLAAYEWNQNSGENIYQDNIIQLSMNALTELYEAGNTGGGTGIGSSKTSGTILLVEGNSLSVSSEIAMTNVCLYAVTGNLCQQYVVNDSSFTTSLSNLIDGVYILKIERTDGEIITKKFIK